MLENTIESADNYTESRKRKHNRPFNPTPVSRKSCGNLGAFPHSADPPEESDYGRFPSRPIPFSMIFCNYFVNKETQSKKGRSRPFYLLLIPLNPEGEGEKPCEEIPPWG